MAKRTPSQTVGPFFSFALLGSAGPSFPRAEGGPVLRIEGRVLDGAGDPVPDTMIEWWRADVDGRYDNAGFGRTGADENGRFRFDSVKPGRVPGPGDALQAPHIVLTIFARGLLSHVSTRLYFADEAEANAEDPILAVVAPERRATLVATREDGPDRPLYRFDVHLQGDEETVFFEF